MRAQWKKFAEEYLKCWCQTQAAIRAGYSERSAYNQGHRLMKNDEVQAYIQERLAALKMEADEVLVRLGEQARARYADYLTVEPIPFGDEGETISLPVFDFEACQADGNLHLIKKIKYKDDLAEVEFYDAQTALIKIGQHHRLFNDQPQVNVDLDVQVTADDLIAARDAAQQVEDELLGSTRADDDNG